MMTKEPIIGMGMQSQQPQFVVGEAGPERLDVTPMTGPGGYAPGSAAANYAGGMGNMRANLGGYMEAGSAALPPPSMNPALLRILAANLGKVRFRPSYSTAGA